MILKPLPRRPLTVRDELLSSWLGRLARANHCPAEELCGYLGVGQGRVPKYANDLRMVNWARLCAAVQRSPEEIVAMTLPDTTHRGVHCVSRHDFQTCTACKEQTPELILRHWRFAWSLTCKACGRALAAMHPSEGVSNRLLVRAARGAEALKAAVATNDLRLMRRIDLTLCLLKMLGLAYTAPLTSQAQLERFTALAPVDVCTSRPLLGAAIALRGNDQVARELRRFFPQHRRAVERIRTLSQDFDQRHPRQPREEPALEKETYRTNQPKASESALKAAHQAISELGPDANRQVLLARADAIWKRRSGAEY